ncbi:hypothetical protein ACQQ2N_16125 [Dokdonella sp. MW10]|uniref:hypothetical protein n=1 Tax=Dokdonella sp. MW10 TaxID=2992926 RepID=UPI003F7EE80C
MPLFTAAIASLLAGSGAHAADPAPVALPDAQSVTITALRDSPPGGNNALLQVRYPKGHELPADVTLQVDGRHVVVKRDPKAPETFSGTIPFDFARFVEEQARRKQLAAGIAKTPVFRGREILGERPVAFIDPDRLRRDIDTGTPFEIPAEAGAGIAALTSAERSLMVVHPRVVEDRDRTFDACTRRGNPRGAWTFNALMTNMANEPATGVNAAEFVERWLKGWTVDQNVNTFDIVKRPLMADLVLDVWPRDGAGRLDLEQSPMRLLAIVNRVDLRGNLVYGGGGDAGEGRFVFGVMQRDRDGNCSEMPFTVILEYGVPLEGCRDVQAWGRKWHDLDGFVLGSSTYNAALQDLTDVFTSADAAPGKPNGSAINQIRTNENALDRLWELREFNVGASSQHLETVSTKLTPHRETYNPFPAPHTSTLQADFVNGNAPTILLDGHDVPATFLGQPFLTGASLNPSTAPAAAWIHPAIFDNDARHHFSLNTCDACHGSETATRFLHVFPRSMGTQAALSRFLTGSPGSVTSPGTFTMPDPVSSVPRVYGDLLHRQADLDALVNLDCRAGAVAGGLHKAKSDAITH